MCVPIPYEQYFTILRLNQISQCLHIIALNFKALVGYIEAKVTSSQTALSMCLLQFDPSC